MVKLDVRGLHINDGGLTLDARFNGVITGAAPVITLSVNNGFRSVTCVEASLIVHPSGGYTDVVYDLAEAVYGVDIVRATGLTNPPFFYDVPVRARFLNFSSNTKNYHTYDYYMILGEDANNFGYNAPTHGVLSPLREDVTKVFNLLANKTDGGMVVSFGSDGKLRPSDAITVRVQGLVTFVEPQIIPVEYYDLRLEWSEPNERFELAANASTIGVKDYFDGLVGARMGFSFIYHY